MDTELATLGQINNDSSSAPATDAPDELCIRDVVRMYVLIYSEEGCGRATAMMPDEQQRQSAEEASNSRRTNGRRTRLPYTEAGTTTTMRRPISFGNILCAQLDWRRRWTWILKIDPISFCNITTAAGLYGHGLYVSYYCTTNCLPHPFSGILHFSLSIHR